MFGQVCARCVRVYGLAGRRAAGDRVELELRTHDVVSHVVDDAAAVDVPDAHVDEALEGRHHAVPDGRVQLQPVQLVVGVQVVQPATASRTQHCN